MTGADEKEASRIIDVANSSRIEWLPDYDAHLLSLWLLGRKR